MVQSLIGVKQIRGIFRTGCQVEWQRTPYVDYQYSLMVFFHENKFLFLIPIYNNLYNDVMKKNSFHFILIINFILNPVIILMLE